MARIRGNPAYFPSGTKENSTLGVIPIQKIRPKPGAQRKQTRMEIISSVKVNTDIVVSIVLDSHRVHKVSRKYDFYDYNIFSEVRAELDNLTTFYVFNLENSTL